MKQGQQINKFVQDLKDSDYSLRKFYNSLLEMNPSQADFIKKTKVRYLKCREGGQHQGEVLNFICIDPACKKKGLICPVCQTTSHNGHQILHLKIFLSQIHKNLCSNDSNEKQILGLAQQLRKIEESKKEMQKVLREMVMQVAEKVKQAEDKINHSYLTLRKLILSQSTVSTKLPELYSLLTGQKQDEETVINQLSKFSQFLEYKNNKIHMIDSAQKLIEEYSKTASSVSIHLSTILPQISSKLSNLPLKVKTLGSSIAQKQVKANYKFSQTQKASTINLVSQKEISLGNDDFGGLAFVEGANSTASVQKISFRIKSCVSGSILLGIGNPENYVNKGYVMNEAENEDLNAISSMGFPLNDFDNPSFVFGDGDVIDVEWNLDEVKLSFSRRNGIQKFDLFPAISQEIKKERFFVALFVGGDSVEIVE